MVKNNKVIDPKKKIEVEGEVLEDLGNTKFTIKVQLSGGQETEIMGYLSGKMRQHYIRLQVGDIVKVEVSPYDLTQGRIIYRSIK